MEALFTTHKKIKFAGHSWNGFLIQNNTYAILTADFCKFFGSRDEKFIAQLLNDISRHGEISAELLESVQKPVKLNTKSSANKSVYTLDILPAVCAEIISAKANGFLLSSQMPAAKQAQKLFDEFSMESFSNEIDRNSGFLDLKLKVKRKLVTSMIQLEPRNEIYWTEILNDEFYDKSLKSLRLGWETALGNEEKLANFIYDAIFIRIPNALFNKLQSERPKRIYVPKTGSIKIQSPELQEFADRISRLMTKCNFDLFNIDKQLHVDFPKFYHREELAFQKLKTVKEFPKMQFDEMITKAFAGRPSEFINTKD